MSEDSQSLTRTSGAFGVAGTLLLLLQALSAVASYYSGSALGYGRELAAGLGTILILCSAVLLLRWSPWSKHASIRYLHAAVLVAIVANSLYLTIVNGQATSATHPPFLLEGSALCFLLEMALARVPKTIVVQEDLPSELAFAQETLSMSVTTYTTLDGEILGETRGGVERDYIPDPLGSVAALIDSSQSKTDAFTYWPYGEERSRTGNTPTPFRFVGAFGYYRDESGRAYVRGRVLRTRNARWLTVDPLWPGESAYEYAEGNPARGVDPSGLGTGPCGVYRCVVNDSSLRHTFVCVDGPSGGCSGGLYPSCFGGPGDRYSEPCTSISGVTCTLYSSDCNVAGNVCDSIKNSPGNDCDYILGGACYGFADRKLCDGCNAYPYGSRSYRKCVCSMPCRCNHSFEGLVCFGPKGSVRCNK